MLEQLLDGHPDDRRARQLLIEANLGLGSTLGQAGRLDEARVHDEQAMSGAYTLLGVDPENVATQRLWITTLRQAARHRE